MVNTSTQCCYSVVKGDITDKSDWLSKGLESEVLPAAQTVFEISVYK